MMQFQLQPKLLWIHEISHMMSQPSSLARSIWNPPWFWLSTWNIRGQVGIQKLMSEGNMRQDVTCSVEKPARNPCLMNMVDMNKYDTSWYTDSMTVAPWDLWVCWWVSVPWNLRLLEGSRWCYVANVATPCKFSDTIQGSMTPPESHVSSRSCKNIYIYISLFRPFLLVPGLQSSSIQCSLCFLPQVPKVTHSECLKWLWHRKLQVHNPASIVSRDHRLLHRFHWPFCWFNKQSQRLWHISIHSHPLTL